jgi:hypothetical protein
MKLHLSLGRAALLGLTLIALSPTAGCAVERAPINRVQADALAKSFFVGDLADATDNPEFYMRTTVVDAAVGAGADGLFTSSDAQPTTRIRWEITEKVLLARLTYELVEDTDHKGARRVPDGQVVAAFTIEKHFDIRREYNPVTGEENNVVVENETDLTWDKRSFFRVDWSRNLVTDAYSLDTLSQLGLYGVRWDALAYTVSDPSSPDAPVFDVERGYFDITTKAFATPEILEDEWGPFPACWLVGRFPTESCDPSEITLRAAFLKVEDHDYEPLDFDGTRMDLFGWFTNDRFGYDRRHGVVDDRWHRFASRWNLFEKSHASPVVVCNTPETTPTLADPHRDEDGDGTEDECKSVGRGSRCDDIRGECTIPMRDRKVKTIVWHVNEEFPEELFEGTKKALDGWSEGIRVALVAARLAECRRTKGTGCEAEMGWPERWSGEFSPALGTSTPAEVPRVFLLCHNPVDSKKGDDPLCGPDQTRVRLGDLRYNLINVIQSPQITAPWGIMVDAEDPLTGEKIAGSVNEWGSVLDRAASSLVDLLGLINGEIPPDEFIAGKSVEDWVKANQPGGKATKGSPMSAAETASRKKAFDPKVIAGYLDGVPTGKPGAPPAVRRKARLEALVDSGRLGPGNAELSARMSALRGTKVEAAMVSPELAQAAGYDPTGPISKDAIRRASPFGRINPSLRRERERRERLSRASRHACRVDEPEPDNLLGLAKEAAKLFPSPDPNDPKAVNEHKKAVYLWARQQYSAGVLAHELGHSMGLRHNFAASFDSLNYRPEYWQLRTRNGAVTEDCAEGTVDGTSCIGPRWRDPVSDEEIENNIGRYATTSVMDYPGDQNHDMLLQGKYDQAAMRFGYGNVVDVWAAEGLSVKGKGKDKALAYELTAFTVNPGLFGVYYFPPVSPTQAYEFIHYSQYNKEFGLIEGCADSGEPGAILGKKCEEQALDVVDYRDMRDFASDPDYAKFSWGNNPRAVDGAGRVRRGYLFSSDEFSDSGNVPSFTYDAGADAYEQIRFLESGYENRYILDSFRRNRVDFNSEGVMGRIQSHYLDNLQLIAKAFAFGAVLDGDPTKPADDFLADGYYGPLAMGSTVAFDLFARILTRPEPGYYCPADVCATSTPFGVDETLFVADPAPLPEKYLYDYRVALGDGRYVHNDFDYSKGYWWADYQTQVGAYYDKIWSVYYLAEAFDSFISNSKDDFTDGRYKNVNFATVYPEQVRRLYANLLTGDMQSFSPWVVVPDDPADTPTGTLRYPEWIQLGAVPARPAKAKLADPNYSFNEQLYAMVYGAMFFPTNWSTSFVHDARITALSSEQVSWPAAETFTFYDPASGVTYRAHATGTEELLGKTHQRGTGARMLEWANHLLSIAYLVERDAQGNVLQNPDGTPMLKLDAAGKAQKDPAHPGAAAALQKYVDQIDLFRQLIATFEHPLDEWSLPQP